MSVVEGDFVAVGGDEVVVTEAQHRSGLERFGGWLPDTADLVQTVESEDAQFFVGGADDYVLAEDVKRSEFGHRLNRAELCGTVVVERQGDTVVDLPGRTSSSRVDCANDDRSISEHISGRGSEIRRNAAERFGAALVEPEVFPNKVAGRVVVGPDNNNVLPHHTEILDVRRLDGELHLGSPSTNTDTVPSSVPRMSHASVVTAAPTAAPLLNWISVALADGSNGLMPRRNVEPSCARRFYRRLRN